MNDKFLILAITSSEPQFKEPEKITRLLENNEVKYVHIRKPDYPIEKIEHLIEQIPEDFHSRLKLHDHFELADKFKIGGLHLNGRNPGTTRTYLKISRSFHSLEELKDTEQYEYVTLSPVFDSISKVGYKGNFNLEDLKIHLQNKRVIALGGVVPEKFKLLKDVGFYGAAMLGYFWK